MGNAECQVRGIPIKDVKAGMRVYSLNEETGRIEPHRINGLLDMGVKPVFRLTTASGRTIRTTGNHPYLTKAGWQKVVELAVGEEIAVPREGARARLGTLMLDVPILSNRLDGKVDPDQQRNAQRDDARHQSLLGLSMQDRAHDEKPDRRDGNANLHDQNQRSLEDKVTDQQPHDQEFEDIQERLAQPLSLLLGQFHHSSLYHALASVSSEPDGGRRSGWGTVPGFEGTGDRNAEWGMRIAEWNNGDGSSVRKEKGSDPFAQDRRGR